MVAYAALSPPIALGAGKSLCPPAGWTAYGRITDNPLWLLPKSRMRWTPPGIERLALHWSLSMAPLVEAQMAVLISVLKGLPGPVSSERIEQLAGGLIRMPLKSVRQAEVTSYRKSGRLLRVEYVFDEYDEAGIVHYAPTEMHEFGEFQILAFEGKLPAFNQFLAVAQAAMETFTVGEAPLREALTNELLTNEPLTDGPLTDEPLAAEALTREPASHEGRRSSQNPPQRPPVTTASASAHGGRGRLTKEDLLRMPVVTYTLAPGDTVKSIARRRWPALDETALADKVRDIYALNLARGNQIDAWNLRPGASLLLPDE